ncbi:MAG: histidinol dehydrogenase, partial [Mangrovibacterium sp.]
MKRYINPPEKIWNDLLERPVTDATVLFAQVQPVLDEIRQEGTKALKKYTERFDGVSLDNFRVEAGELSQSVTTLDAGLKSAIEKAAENIFRFHQIQKPRINRLETLPGVHCWQKAVPIEKVGLYVPGGSAPLFSTVLMLGIPAKIAGCRNIVLCSPPNSEGKVHPAILYAAKIAGISQIFKLGGVQAIGAMAFGT